MTHLADETLLGSDFAAVCARYGGPVSCEYEHGVLRLMYESEEGDQQRGVVELVDGVVVSVTPSIRRTTRACYGQEMVGWPVELVLPKLGKPVRSTVMGESRRLEFERYVVTVHEGTVACVEPLTSSPAASA